MARFKIYLDPKNKKLGSITTSYGDMIPKKIMVNKETIKLIETGRTLPKNRIQFIDITTNQAISYTKLKSGEYDFYQISTRKTYMLIVVCLFCIFTPLSFRFLRKVPQGTISNLALVIFIIVMLGLSKLEISRAKKIALELYNKINLKK